MVSITYFVHSTTIDNEARVSSGWSDPLLSEKGILQARELGTLVDANQFDAIFVSDTIRTITTAFLAFPEHKHKVKIDARIRECNYGTYDGHLSSEVEPLQEKSITEPIPGGESYEMVKNRISNFLDYIKKDFNNKHIAIIAHKAPQLALDVLIKNMTWEEAFKNDWRKTKNWQPGWIYELN